MIRKPIYPVAPLGSLAMERYLKQIKLFREQESSKFPESHVMKERNPYPLLNKI